MSIFDEAGTSINETPPLQEVNATTTSQPVNNAPQAQQPYMSSLGTPEALSEQHSFDTIKYGLPGLAAGLVDTMGTSVGLLKDSTVSNTLKSVFGPTGFGDWYARNREAVRTGSDIVGMFIPATLGVKVLKSARMAREAGTFGEFLKNSKTADVLLGSSTRLSELQKGIYSAEAAGDTGIAADQASTFGLFTGRTMNTTAVGSAKMNYYKGQLAESLRQSAVFETMYAGLFNTSPLVPADSTTSDYVSWGAAGAAFQSGIDHIAARFAAGKLVRAASTIASSLRPLDKTMTDSLIFRPGSRGAGISLTAASKNDILEQAKTSGNATIVSNATSDVNISDGILHKQLNELASDYYPLNNLTSIKLTDEQHTNLLNVLSKNPTTLMPAVKLSSLPSDRGSFLQHIANTAQTTKDSIAQLSILSDKTDAPADLSLALQKLRSTLDATHDFRYVIEGDGALSAYDSRASRWLDKNSFSDIKVTKRLPTPAEAPSTGIDVTAASNLTTKALSAFQNKPIPTYVATSGAKNEVSVDALFHINMPTKPVQADFQALQAVGSFMNSKYKLPDWLGEIPLSPKRPWRELDLIASVAKNHPELNDHLALSGFNSMDDVMLHITNERYKEFVQALPFVQSADRTSGKVPGWKKQILPEDLMQRLNMPETAFGEPSPLQSLYTDFAASGEPDLMFAFGKAPSSSTKLELLQAAMRESAGISDATVQPSLAGNAWFQKDIKPVMVHAKSMPDLTRSDTLLQSSANAIRQQVVQKLALVTPDEAPVVNAVVTSVSSTPALDAARNVSSLFDGNGAGTGVMTYGDRVAEYNPTLKSMQLISQLSDQVIRTAVGKQMESQEAFTAHLLDPKYKADAIDVNRVQHAYRHGFAVSHVDFGIPAAGQDISNVPVTYVLDQKDPRNLMALRRYFNNDAAVFPENANGEWLMPDMSLHNIEGKTIIPLQTSAYAGAAIKNLSDLMVKAAQENNVLRRLYGAPEMMVRPFHLPAPELHSDRAWFLLNSKGETVNIFSTGTLADNKKQALETAQALISRTGEQHTAVPADVFAQQAQHDGTLFDIIDYSDFLRKNAGMKGGLINSQIDQTPQSYVDMVRSLTKNWMANGVRARALMLEPQLNYARQAAAVSGTIGGKLNEYNIFDRYIATALSRPTRNPGGMVASAYRSIENVFDGGLSVAQNVWDKARGVADDATSSFIKKNVDKTVYEQYQRAAESWSPFRSAADWLESTYKPRAPWTSKATMTELSKISNALALRILNPGTAALNYLGVASVLPTVVDGLRRKPGQSLEEWQNLNALWGAGYKNDVATVSPMKMLIQGIKREFDGSLTEPLRKAAELGMVKPEYTSLDDILTQENLGKKSGLDRFIQGSSWIADKSEEHSRKIVWGIGYAIAKDFMNVQDDRNAFLFAQHMVNQTIGNYTPLNRPGIFQGALGMPLGAFQTYMFNYYRRLFSYVENRSVRDLATQAALQGSVFGIAGLPGWNLFNQYIGSNATFSNNLENTINTKMSPLASELLLHGTVSNIPRIFGQDGLALYSRGSIDMTKYMPSTGDVLTLTPTPLSYLYDANRLPPLQLLTNTGNIIAKTIDNELSGFSLQRQEEILGAFSTNRFIKNLMDMAANNTVDRSGQVVQSGTRDFIHLAATLAGTVPSSERLMQDAYYKQRIVEANQNALRKQLDERMRAKIRSGSFDVSDMQDAASEYVQSGGNPQYFATWLRGNMITATQEKTDRKMRQLLSSGKGVEFQNILAAMQKEPDDSDQEGNGGQME